MGKTASYLSTLRIYGSGLGREGEAQCTIHMGGIVPSEPITVAGATIFHSSLSIFLRVAR